MVRTVLQIWIDFQDGSAAVAIDAAFAFHRTSARPAGSSKLNLTPSSRISEMKEGRGGSFGPVADARFVGPGDRNWSKFRHQ